MALCVVIFHRFQQIERARRRAPTLLVVDDEVLRVVILLDWHPQSLQIHQLGMIQISDDIRLPSASHIEFELTQMPQQLGAPLHIEGQCN